MVQPLQSLGPLHPTQYSLLPHDHPSKSGLCETGLADDQYLSDEATNQIEARPMSFSSDTEDDEEPLESANTGDSTGSPGTSPSKARPIARVVGKAKGLVRKLTFRKSGHKSLGSVSSNCSSTSASTISSGYPRPSISILVTSASSSDVNISSTRSSARSMSLTSTMGIYSPEYSVSTNPSVASLSIAPNLSDPFQEQEISQSMWDDMDMDKVQETEASDNAINLRTLFFLPWCIAVGVTIMFFPAHIERVIFSTGYTPSPSPQGIHRFTFLAETARHWVMTFMFMMVLLFCVSPIWGGIIGAFCVGILLWVWKGYQLKDMCCYIGRVGKDDMETVAIVSCFVDTKDSGSPCINHPRPSADRAATT